MNLDPEFGDFFQTIAKYAVKISHTESPVPYNPIVIDIWGAIYSKGDRTISHDHWPALWSFCYYVSAPEGSAPLVFTSNNYEIQPKSGLLVMFPGWVKHHVPVQNIEAERIVVAGNIRMTTAPG